MYYTEAGCIDLVRSVLGSLCPLLYVTYTLESVLLSIFRSIMSGFGLVRYAGGRRTFVKITVSTIFASIVAAGSPMLSVFLFVSSVYIARTRLGVFVCCTCVVR